MKKEEFTLSDSNYQLWIDYYCRNYQYKESDGDREVFAKQKFKKEQARNIQAEQKAQAVEGIEISDVEIT